MTVNIRILPDVLANRIAAGEVVERPASVVKELTENSLDAGARNVTVEVAGSGRQLVKVEDDGEGMSPDDLLIALERHATSKIRSVSDLYSVNTLGFRGEALPSIASVSRMRIASSRGNGTPGTIVRIEGGLIKKVEEVARPAGTTVEVRSLFFNTPARLKFMKSEATERGWINTVFQQQALAHPGVNFHLRVGNRETMKAPSTNSLRDRVASLFGHDLAQALVEVEHQVNGPGGVKLTGLISEPALSRSGRDMQFTFVNGRCVREVVAMGAIAQGYRTLLPRGRYPVVFLYLEVDPASVDVNVHPAKLEVKFQDYRKVREAIVQSINRGLFSERQPAGRPHYDSRREWKTFSWTGGREGFMSPAGGPASDSVAPETPDETGAPSPAAAKAPPLEWQMRLPVSSGFSPLGQVHDAFIVAGSSEGIVIIDQHTAHERILYEKIVQQFQESRVSSQYLLIPQPVNLSPLEAALIEEKREELERLGFSVEAFGKGTALLRSVPALLSERDYTKIFQEVAAHLAEEGRLKPFEELADELATIMACRGAIKAGEPLDEVRTASLLQELESLGKTASCPHGRPIYLLLGIDEIKKKFLRN